MPFSYFYYGDTVIGQKNNKDTHIDVFDDFLDIQGCY